MNTSYVKELLSCPGIPNQFVLEFALDTLKTPALFGNETLLFCGQLNSVLLNIVLCVYIYKYVNIVVLMNDFPHMHSVMYV